VHPHDAGLSTHMDLELEVAGKRITVRDLPITTWKELRPFWPQIAKAVLEVFIEGHFQPYEVSRTRPDGSFASSYYWAESLHRPSVYPLKEAKRFVRALKEKDAFVKALNDFNRRARSKWATSHDQRQLRHFVHSICQQLKPSIELLVPFSEEIPNESVESA
jgi:hypothetical protein